jgi:pyruvate dehydrogenase E1 component
VRAYDPAYAYELAAVVRDGITRMFHDGEDVFYYVTVYNENYEQPPMPEGVDEGIVRGLYRFAAAPGIKDAKGHVRLVGSGSILQQVLAARDLLAERFGIAADVYSATSFQELRRDAQATERWNRLNPERKPRVPYVSKVLGPNGGPIVIATDWIRQLPDMVARWLPQPYLALGTDGYGRSDTREALRSFFEIDPPHIAAAALSGLTRCGSYEPKAAARAIRELGVDPDAPDPLAR